MVPARGVHHNAGEGVRPVKLGQVRLLECAASADEESGGDFVPRVKLDPPQLLLVVEFGGNDLGVEADPRSDRVLVDTMLGVGLQFTARGVNARPMVALLKGERSE